MAMEKHCYGLEWIDEDALYEVTEHAFAGVIELAKDAALRTPPDPFTIVVQAVIFDQDANSMMAFEKLRAINKSISNAVGNWHQAVLGLAEGWNNLGSNGGGVDLMATGSAGEKPMAIEVKNRYNTIKGSDEKNMWDKLETISKANGAPSYIVQIVPKTPERYDRPWRVSCRTEKPNIRCCDGATAYAKAFGVENALEELYKVFPRILEDVIGGESFDDAGMFEYFLISMPCEVSK